MGVDCIFYVELSDENEAVDLFDALTDMVTAGKTPLTRPLEGHEIEEKIRLRFVSVKYPMFAYCFLRRKGRFVVIEDGCRFHLNKESYQVDVLRMLTSISNGKQAIVIRDDTPRCPWEINP